MKCNSVNPYGKDGKGRLDLTTGLLWLQGRKLPIATTLALLVPAVAQAKGPIVRAGPDIWGAILSLVRFLY